MECGRLAIADIHPVLQTLRAVTKVLAACYGDRSNCSEDTQPHTVETLQRQLRYFGCVTIPIKGQ